MRSKKSKDMKICKNLYADHCTFLTDEWILWEDNIPKERRKPGNENVTNEEVFSCKTKEEFMLRLAVMGLKLGKKRKKKQIFGPYYDICKI